MWPGSVTGRQDMTKAGDLLEALRTKIENKSARVGIIGLGYVGLPLAIHFCKAGFKVIGFDLDEKKINLLRAGQSYIRHVPAEPIAELTTAGQCQPTTDFSRLTDTDCILICVPTPLTEKLEPDLSYLVSTTETIQRYLRRGQLIVLESTTYPGTTDEMLLPMLEATGLKAGRDFALAFSPEREDPGNQEYGTGNTPKVVGGITPACLQAACTLYDAVTTTVPVSSTRAAELTKLLENTYRSVNIALVNEIKILAHKMGIDLFEVIDAAATKPFGYTPFYPGPGLGGHCIPIDPFYLAWKAKEYDFSARFIHLAGEINVAMPYYVVEKTAEALNQHRKSINGSRILILGIAYKKDIDDDRESPGYAIMDMLMQKGAEVCYNDPWIPVLKPTRKYDFNLKSETLAPEFLANLDAVIIVTDHSEYDFAQIVKHAQVVVDTATPRPVSRPAKRK